MGKAILDTSILLSQGGVGDFDGYYIPISVVEELETISNFSDILTRKQYAIEALKWIKDNKDKIEVVVEIEPVGRYTWLNTSINTNVTLVYAEHIYNNKDSDTKFITNELSTYEKSKHMKLDSELR